MIWGIFKIFNNIVKRARLILPMLLLSSILPAQDTLPKNYFINPLDIPISLAGTFGEIRTDHYHTGIDIRTNGKEGLPVHAAADGYVSRIVVSPYGYGNALYITHPNGYISLYGHLSHFNDTITSFVKRKQYGEEKYRQDFPVPKGTFTVNKGDIIAFSGSTGASEGPHLHFEIRNTKNDEAPINPLLAGYMVEDTLAPIIKGIALYPLNDSSTINGMHEPFYCKVKKKKKLYELISPMPIKAYGSIGVGISCYDVAEGTDNRNGPYIKLLKDNEDTIYYSRMNVLSFYTMRFINGHIDYAAMHDRIDTIEYSFLQDNDKLNIYKKLVNKGRINFKTNTVHTLEYCISDYNGNTSRLVFNIIGDKQPLSIYHNTAKYFAIANWRTTFDYSAKGMKIEIPEGALFNNMSFYYSEDSSKGNTEISSVYSIQNENIPLSAAYTLMLKPNSGLSDSLLKKAVVVRLEGNDKSSIGGKWDNGYMTIHPKSFGRYVIMLDLERPVIKPVNILKGKDMSHDKEIIFKVTDNLDMSLYRCTVDGKWILMEFNPKSNEIYYTFDEHVRKGHHHLRLVVGDEVGNTSVYETDFVR